MTWCDKLASVPTVGLMLDFHFASSDNILSALSPVLDGLVTNRKPSFELEKLEPFAVIVNTHEGFKYSVEPSKISVGFNHRMRPKAVSGGPPVMEMLSRPMPFSDLLPTVSKKLYDTVVAFPNPKERTLQRYGIVAATPVDEDELPPGIRKMIKYLGQPWGALSDAFSIQIAARLPKGSNYYDRCVHTLLRSDDPNELITVMLDYQRVFNSGQPITAASLKDVGASTERAALKYFEDLAEGNRFDDIDIRNEADA